MILRNLYKFSQTERVAVYHDNEPLTFKDLYNRSQAMAYYIKDNYNSNKPIAIYGDKESDIIVCLFASLLARKTYVILPDVYPVDRLNYILKDCDADVLFNASKNFFESGLKHFDSDDFTKIMDNYTNRERIEFDDSIDMDATAFMIYTSGSTGNPKGVEISYQNLKYKIEMYKSYYDALINMFINKPGEWGGSYRIASMSSYGFGISLDLFYFLGEAGATWCAISTEIVRNLTKLVEHLVKIQPNSFTITPSLAKKLLASDEFNSNGLHELLFLSMGGEPLFKDLAKELFERFDKARVSDGYGSTETTAVGVGATVDSKVLDAVTTNMPVSLQAESQIIMLLDEEGKRIEKDDEPGEIVFFGDFITKGYHNNPELTKEHYYHLEDGTKAFRTGDMGYYSNGYLFLSGRKDNQIKVGGNRIEIEDVEAHIKRTSIVEDCAVGVKTDEKNVNILVGFVILKEEFKVNKNIENFLTIKKELLNMVEGYKIPQKILFVDKLPKNLNGKLDRKAIKELANK